jgi:dynein heavy chain
MLLPAVPELLNLLKEADEKLILITKTLHAYLEVKREGFARFYFLSNEELLEILGESRKPELVQPHLKKCFEGIDVLLFKNKEIPEVSIVGFLSKEGEQVTILKSVMPLEYQNSVERWLLEL